MIERTERPENDGMHEMDLAVVGAGPCGIAVGAAAARNGVSATLFDKGCITNSIVNYPYYMTFFSTARMLEVGGVPFTIPDSKPTRREALAYYRFVVEHFGMAVHQYEAVQEIGGTAGRFHIRTRSMGGEEHQYLARAVVMATGGFHQPNQLGVPGEDLAKVKHYYHEPFPYFGQKVLVVGAGNSAVESALEMYRNGVHVSMVHFLDRIDRGVKPWVVPDISNRLDRGEIPMFWNHRVAEVRWDSVLLRSEVDGSEKEIENDWVLAMTGWRPDPVLLRSLGVGIDLETGIPHHDPGTMETDVPGIYIAGVLAAGNNANKIFIENGREHGDRIATHLLTGTRPDPGG
jgi:thioredoxin reductase (NADPH)